MGLIDFLGEAYGKLVAVGVFLLLVGGGLTLWSYVNRDPVSGEFYVWPKMLISGAVFSVAGIVWWRATEY